MAHAVAMATGHDDDHGHDDHGAHGHDDHHDDHGPTSNFWVVPPIVVGLIIGIVLIAIFGLDARALPGV